MHNKGCSKLTMWQDDLSHAVEILSYYIDLEKQFVAARP
jgi:hypothetical protein